MKRYAKLPQISLLQDLIYVSRISLSFHIALPTIVDEKLRISPGYVLGFYEEGGGIMIQKMN